jgi:hypothetical protein
VPAGNKRLLLAGTNAPEPPAPKLTSGGHQHRYYEGGGKDQVAIEAPEQLPDRLHGFSFSPAMEIAFPEFGLVAELSTGREKLPLEIPGHSSVASNQAITNLLNYPITKFLNYQFPSVPSVPLW